MPRTSLSTPPPPQPTTFDADVRSAVQAVRKAISGALEATSLDPSVPQAASRALGIDKSLAWKLCRIVTESDPALVASRLPGDNGVRIFARALKKAGAPGEVIDSLKDAVARFRDTQARHAYDRDTFAAMLTGSSSSRSREEAHRRQSFLGNSATWGIRAALQLSAQAIAPSATPGKLDLARAGGFIGFQRLRNDLPWAVANIAIHDDEGRFKTSDSFGPIDPAGITPGGVPLMPEFCSPWLPEMTLSRTPNGRTRLMVGEAPLGRAGLMDVVTGWVRRGVFSAVRTPEDQTGSHNTSLNTPAELLIHDLLVHRDLAFAMTPRAHIFNQLPSGPVYPADGMEAGAMRISLSLESPGGRDAPPDLTTPEFLAYPRLAARMAAALGRPLDEFVGFRLRVPFPPVPAMSVLRHDLAASERPTGIAGQSEAAAT